MTTAPRPARRPRSKADTTAGLPTATTGVIARENADAEPLRASVRLLQRENGILRLLVAIHDRLGAMVLEGANGDSIAGALAALVNRPVSLLDHQLRPAGVLFDPARAGREIVWNPNERYIAQVLQTTKGERRALRLPPLPAWGVEQGCVLAPVIVGDATLGYLAIIETDGDADDSEAGEVDLLAVQHAATVYALSLMRQHIADQVSSELKDELLEGLFLGNVTDDQAARERLRRLGYDAETAYRVLVLAATEVSQTPATAAAGSTPWVLTLRMRVLDALQQLIRERAPNAIVTSRPNELVVLLPDERALAAESLGKLASAHVTSFYSDWALTVGIGGLAATPGAIGPSYAQARRALAVALRFGQQGQVISFENLGLYRLLFHLTDRAELRAFVDQVLGGLIEYDRKHRTDFLRTVAVYLTNNNNLQSTARELFVHVNTAAYRLQRIQAITGLDLTHTDDCLLVKVALMIQEDIEV